MSRKFVYRELEQSLKQSEITPELPCHFGSPAPLPAGIVGATITAIGSIAGDDYGLVIEYREKGSRFRRRVFLSFGDCGMYPIASVLVGTRQ